MFLPGLMMFKLQLDAVVSRPDFLYEQERLSNLNEASRVCLMSKLMKTTSVEEMKSTETLGWMVDDFL
jgi:hypothetical protein